MDDVSQSADAITCRIHGMTLFGASWPPQAFITGHAFRRGRTGALRIFVRTGRGIVGETLADLPRPDLAVRFPHERAAGNSGFSVVVPFRRDVLLRCELIAETDGGLQLRKRVYLPWARPSLTSVLTLLRITHNRLRRAADRWKPSPRWGYPKLRAHKVHDGREREPARTAPVRAPAVKLIAFYLPQFHPIPENDAWWEPGFTEWINVTRALPQFEGHFQPRLPADLGFYDLRLPEVMARQAALAGHFGIHGFCFYHFWFAGRRLLERPVNGFMANPSIDFPFCLCWANENWSRRWDGSEQDVLMQQDYGAEHDARFIDDLVPYLRDPRYIHIDGRPLLILYRVNEIPDIAAKLDAWRQRCRHHGIAPLHVVAAQTFGMRQPRAYGIDSAVEFPPHLPTPPSRREFFNTGFKGQVYDYESLVQVYLDNRAGDDYELFKTVVPCWDNTARKERDARIFDRCAPDKYAAWLEAACHDALQRLPAGRRYVFINAWNEWAEGAYLEPDQRFGYAFLNATADVLDGLVAPEVQDAAPVGDERPAGAGVPV